jgi:hypothetical protein
VLLTAYISTFHTCTHIPFHVFPKQFHEKLQKEIKGLNKLVERHEQRCEFHYKLRINFEDELKGKMGEIEELQGQLIEMREQSAVENENLQLKY